MAGGDVESGGNLVNVRQCQEIFMDIGNQRGDGLRICGFGTNDIVLHHCRRMFFYIFYQYHKKLRQADEDEVVGIAVLFFVHFPDDACGFVVIFCGEREAVIVEDGQKFLDGFRGEVLL